jgi:hypothetical protein
MNPLIQFKPTVLPPLISVVLACFGLSPTVQAANETTGNANTGEGDGALQSITTGTNNTALGAGALFSDMTASHNTATGAQALQSNTTGGRNTANGFEALFHNTTGTINTASGVKALFNNTTGIDNTATGINALFHNTTANNNTAYGGDALVDNFGHDNTATGVDALFHNTSGNSNIALGSDAGSNLTTGSNNIDIGNPGVAAEANTIRIGGVEQTATFIAGISGVGVTGTAVHVNAAGQLGTVPSSARFKDDIKPMDKASEVILALKPVTFRYKQEIDPAHSPQFGLVAEEVAKINPDLVTRDAKGELYTVRYDAVNAMLLNEFLKEHTTVDELKKEIATLTATVKEQASQIQKVSAQIEVTKPAPQVVNNDQ